MATRPHLNGHRLPAKARRAVANAPAAPAPSTDDKITAERVTMSLRTRFDPLPSLTPPLLVSYLRNFDYGYLEMAARTWDAMERRDDRLASVSSKAKSALARYGFEVVVSSDIPEALKADAEKHKAALEYLFGNCTATNAVREDETGGFSLLVRQMADAIGKRYSVHEIVWEPDGAGQLTATFRHAPLWFFEAITGRLRFKLQDGVAEGVPMDPDAWLVTVGEGIMEACSVLWVYKHLPLRDWLAYSEKFGMPYLLGKTSAIFNSPEWQAMVGALRGFGNDGAAVVSGGDDIVPVKVGGGSETTPFPGLVDRSERGMSILWRGADLGTQSHSGGGKGQGASLQADETSALDEDRAQWLTESLIPVSRTAIKYLFGLGVKPLAYVRIKTEVKRDIQLDLAVDTFLISNGVPVGIDDTLERYSRPTPGPDEELLKPAAASAGVAGAAKEDEAEATIEKAANERATEIVTQLRADEAAAKLQRAALRQFAEGVAKDFAPIRERLLLIAENEDPSVMRAALVKLRRDLPGMFVAMNVRPSAVKPLADAMAASLFNGVINGAVQTHQTEDKFQ